jgi:hypothetical protein
MASCELSISPKEVFTRLLSDGSPFFKAHKESLQVLQFLSLSLLHAWTQSRLNESHACPPPLNQVTEIRVDPWADPDAGSGMMRETMYRYPLNQVGCPPSTMIREVQRCRYDEERDELLLDTSCQSLDVPYGLYFTIENRLRFKPGEGGSQLDITMQTNFTKSTWMEARRGTLTPVA